MIARIWEADKPLPGLLANPLRRPVPYSHICAKGLGAPSLRRHSLTNIRDDFPLTADNALRASLIAVLGLDAARVARFDDQTLLFGALPELDSMAVATLLTDFEDRLGIRIDDDDVDAESFERFGALRDMLARKLSQRAS